MNDEAIAEVLRKIVDIVVVPANSVVVFRCDRELNMNQADQMKRAWHAIVPETRAVFVSGIETITAIVTEPVPPPPPNHGRPIGGWK